MAAAAASTLCRPLRTPRPRKRDYERPARAPLLPRGAARLSLRPGQGADRRAAPAPAPPLLQSVQRVLTARCAPGTAPASAHVRAGGRFVSARPKREGRARHRRHFLPGRRALARARAPSHPNHGRLAGVVPGAARRLARRAVGRRQSQPGEIGPARCVAEAMQRFGGGSGPASGRAAARHSGWNRAPRGRPPAPHRPLRVG